MKIILKTKPLLAAVQNLVKVVPAKTANPVLENILVKASDEGTAFLASDLETSLAMTIPSAGDDAVTEEKGIIALPARIFLDIVKQIEDESIRIESKENTAELIWAKGRSNIPTFNPKDYPEVILSIKDGCSFDIPGTELADGIAATQYATATDPIRPQLTGIFFDVRSDGLTLVASDSHRLAMRTVPSVTVSEGRSFILPRRNAPIIKALAEDAESVSVRFDDKNATFSFGNATIGTRSVNGKFPNYRSVIPKNNTNELTVDPKTLISALKRVSVCANRNTNQVKVTINPDITGATVEILAEDFGYSTKAAEKLAVDYIGTALAVGFKSTFLIELLESFGDQPVRILLSDEKRAVYAVPAEAEEGSHSSTILMPIATK